MKIDHESLTGTFEQQKAQVQKFNLMDDDFFAVVMKHKEAFQVMLRILTGRDDLNVIEVRTQYTIRNIIGHSVILDGYAEDQEHNLYNIEVQVRDNDYHPKRVRYYQSSTDLTMMEKGKKYKELPDLYLIFISSFDWFKKGKNHYIVRRMLDGFNEEVPNGVHELYFNTEVKDDTAISRLLQYFENSEPENTEFGSLSKYVKYYKETEEGVKHMCQAVIEYGDEREKEGRNKGREEGRSEGKAENIVQTISNIMANMKCSLEEALRLAGVTMEEYQNSLALLES